MNGKTAKLLRKSAKESGIPWQTFRRTWERRTKGQRALLRTGIKRRLEKP